MRQFHHWLCGSLAGAALVAAVPSGMAQTGSAPPPPELRITDQGRVVSVQKGPTKIPDRAPRSAQMVFETQSVEPNAAACMRPQAMGAAAAEAMVRRIAEAESFYPDFVVAVARRESGFDVAATSQDGAYGLMQLMPATADRFGVDRCDPEENVRGGIRFLRHLWERLRNPFYILAAYNAGEDAVASYKGVPPYPETVAFVAAVISDFYGYPPIGAVAAPEPRAPEGSISVLPARSDSQASAPVRTGARKISHRSGATPHSARRPSPPGAPRQPQKAPPAQGWMVLHLE